MANMPTTICKLNKIEAREEGANVCVWDKIIEQIDEKQTECRISGGKLSAGITNNYEWLRIK